MGALGIAGVLIVLSCVLHYEAMRLISIWLPSSKAALRLRVLLVVFGCLLAHGLEIALYGGAYLGIEWEGWGALEGRLEGHVVDHMYFSAASYSTLGFGDIWPTGMMRMVSSLEAVNGLFLIAWSTTFTYLAMERLWPLHSRVDDGNGDA